MYHKFHFILKFSLKLAGQIRLYVDIPLINSATEILFALITSLLSLCSSSISIQIDKLSKRPSEFFFEEFNSLLVIIANHKLGSSSIRCIHDCCSILTCVFNLVYRFVDY